MVVMIVLHQQMPRETKKERVHNNYKKGEKAFAHASLCNTPSLKYHLLLFGFLHKKAALLR